MPTSEMPSRIRDSAAAGIETIGFIVVTPRGPTPRPGTTRNEVLREADRVVLMCSFLAMRDLGFQRAAA